MRIPRSHTHPGTAAGFTLPAILVVTGALLILAVGILLVAGIESSTARSFVDRQRADLAARAGLEEIRGILTQEAANDDFVVLQSTLASPITPGRDSAPQLFIARGKAAGTGYSYRYIPLFSTLTQPAGDSTLAAPQVEPLLGSTEKEWFDFTTLPYTDKVRAAWLPVRDDRKRTVARYAFWVEDLQARVDPKVAGNDKGAGSTHLRAKWPFPAAGLNDRKLTEQEPDLDQIALYAVDPAASEDQQGATGKTLFKNRGMLLSPDSSLAAAGIQPPVTRDATGHQVDPKARAIEESLAPGLQSYLEQPLVPFADGIEPTAAGTPKLNLNKLLATGGDDAVGEMSAFIRKALPVFDDKTKGRPGGFPDDYLKTLAANAIDYADSDKEATTATGYRGLDAYPLVSEFLFKSRWENVRTVGNRKFLDLSVTIYIELWNMTNIPVKGSAELSYETKYGFQIAPNPNLIRLDDLSKATHGLVKKDGYYWFPAIKDLELQPNEYRVFKCGTVNYSFDAVDASEFIISPLTLTGEANGVSGAGYRMKWNGKLVDQSRGAVHRNDSSINYPSNTKDRPRQRLRTTIPGHSHTRGSFVNNMGDPRMSFYNQAPQDANIYPQNYSPNRRNIRTGSIYSASNANLIYGRVLPSEWPDGGHDSPFGVDAVSSLVKMTQTAFTDDHRIEPDDAGFYGSPPSLLLGEQEAPMRLSKEGRFLSATELGRVYDPVMWQVRGTSSTSNPPGSSWGDVLITSKSSTDYGGGNTLRIGRPEHPAFDKPGLRASRLLDLFHAGRSRSEDMSLREGPLQEIAGRVNINTASKGALRMLIAGRLTQDPEIRRFLSDSHTAGTSKFPAISKITPAPDVTQIADRVADAIIRSRPYASTAELANAVESNGTRVFGNPKLFPDFSTSSYPMMQWTDSAAEETFARAYEASTTRSRNFRVWVIGQALSPGTSGAAPEVLAEVRRCFTIFADPGERNPDGTILPENVRIRILHENDF